MSTAETTNAAAKPITLFGEVYRAPAELTPDRVAGIYNQLSAEGKQRADGLTELAEAFTKAIRFKPESMSVGAFYDSLVNIGGATDEALAPAVQNAIKLGREELEKVPAIRSLLQGADNARTIAGFATLPFQFLSAAASDANTLYQWATTNPAMSAERSRRFAVAHVASHETALRASTATFDTLPSTGIAWDGKLSQQEAYWGQYLLAKIDGISSYIGKVPVLRETVAAVMALWHKISNWDWNTPYTQVYNDMLQTINERAENQPDAQQVFDDNVRGAMQKEAASNAASSLRNFFGKDSPEAAIGQAAANGGTVTTVNGKQVNITANGNPAEHTKPDDGTVLGSQTLGVARDMVVGAASALNPANYSTTTGWAVSSAIVTSGALGATQGTAQAIANYTPDSRIGRGATSLLNVTGAGEEMGAAARFNNKWNVFQRIPRILSRGTGWATLGITDFLTRHTAAAATEMVNGNVLAAGTVSQAIGEKVAGQSDALADAKRFVSAVDTHGPTANVLKRGGKKFFRVLGPVGTVAALAFSADTMANGTEEEKKNETGALALAGTGAGIGFLVGGPPGAVVGGIAGGVVSIADPIASKVGDGIYWAGGKVSGAYNYMFGPNVEEKLAEIAATQDKVLVKYMDRNGDGSLTGAEVQNYLVQSGANLSSVTSLDRDNDGHITSYDIYTVMKAAHAQNGVDEALQTAAVQAEMRARAAAKQGLTTTTAHVGAVTNVDTMNVGGLKPSVNPTPTDVATSLFAPQAGPPRTHT